MDKEKCEYSSALRFVVSKIVPRTLYRVHLDEEFNHKIKQAKKMLKKNPDYSYVVAQNHLTKDDPVFGGYVAYRIDPKRTRYVFAPVSDFHAKSGDQEKDKMIGLADKCGVEMIPIIQARKPDDTEYKYTPTEVKQSHKHFLKRVKELKSLYPTLGCIIPPEGHRYKIGEPKIIEKGIVNIVANLSPVVVVTLGISSPDVLERDEKNFGKRINLNIGDVMIVGVDDKRIDFDKFQASFVNALPPEMRKDYGMLTPKLEVE